METTEQRRKNFRTVSKGEFSDALKEVGIVGCLIRKLEDAQSDDLEELSALYDILEESLLLRDSFLKQNNDKKKIIIFDTMEELYNYVSAQKKKALIYELVKLAYQTQEPCYRQMEHIFKFLIELREGMGLGVTKLLPHNNAKWHREQVLIQDWCEHIESVLQTKILEIAHDPDKIKILEAFALLTEKRGKKLLQKVKSPALDPQQPAKKKRTDT